MPRDTALRFASRPLSLLGLIGSIGFLLVALLNSEYSDSSATLAIVCGVAIIAQAASDTTRSTAARFALFIAASLTIFPSFSFYSALIGLAVLVLGGAGALLPPAGRGDSPLLRIPRTPAPRAVLVAMAVYTVLSAVILIGASRLGTFIGIALGYAFAYGICAYAWNRTDRILLSIAALCSVSSWLGLALIFAGDDIAPIYVWPFPAVIVAIGTTAAVFVRNRRA